MTDDMPYPSPQAIRRAVTDRLKQRAASNGRWTLAELQRQFAYDRLLTRLYAIDADWVLKGAVALLAREVSVRHSMDIDLYRNAERAVIDRELRSAAELDIGDWFRFDIGAPGTLAGITYGVRYPVTAWVGPTKWAAFKMDVVGSDLRMTGVPDHVPPVAGISVPGLDQPGYRAYPLVDHIADKAAAIIEARGDGRPSTRFRDLIDLTVLVACVRVRAADQLTALLSEFDRRSLAVPARFDVPDRGIWATGFSRAARKAVDPPASTLEGALSLVSPYLDPLLDGTATGTWDPGNVRWV